jgi:hypothetical protein
MDEPAPRELIEHVFVMYDHFPKIENRSARVR